MAKELPAKTVAVVFAVAATGTIAVIRGSSSGNGNRNIRGNANDDGSAF